MSILLLFFILTLFVFVVGLCIGSFLNVVILRALSDESICFPRSKCPSCNTQLKWYQNIPVLSYLFLKGKCAFCREAISFQYPVIELITGVLFVIVFLRFDFSLNTLFVWTFVGLFIVMAVTDLKEKVIFDFHAYILLAVGLIYNLFNVGNLYLGDRVLTIGHFSIGVNNSLTASVLGVLLGIVVMEIFARMGYLVVGKRAFGEGDTYIAAALGAIFGWKYLITVLVYSFIIQIIFTIPIYIKKLLQNKDFKTLSSLMFFLLLVIVMKYFDYANVTNNLFIFGAFALTLFCVGIYLCKRILGGLKEEANLTYLPFGPAMVLAALITLFII